MTDAKLLDLIADLAAAVRHGAGPARLIAIERAAREAAAAARRDLDDECSIAERAAEHAGQ